MARRTKKAKRKQSFPKVPANVKSQRLRQLAPKHVFLLPEERKFPYKRYKNGKWVISCADLRDAMRLAAIHRYKQVEQKAKRLYSRHCKRSK